MVGVAAAPGRGSGRCGPGSRSGGLGGAGALEPVELGRPRRRPGKQHADKAYGSVGAAAATSPVGLTPRLALARGPPNQPPASDQSLPPPPPVTVATVSATAPVVASSQGRPEAGVRLLRDAGQGRNRDVVHGPPARRDRAHRAAAEIGLCHVPAGNVGSSEPWPCLVFWHQSVARAAISTRNAR